MWHGKAYIHSSLLFWLATWACGMVKHIFTRRFYFGSLLQFDKMCSFSDSGGQRDARSVHWSGTAVWPAGESHRTALLLPQPLAWWWCCFVACLVAAYDFTAYFFIVYGSMVCGLRVCWCVAYSFVVDASNMPRQSLLSELHVPRANRNIPDAMPVSFPSSSSTRLIRCSWSSSDCWASALLRTWRTIATTRVRGRTTSPSNSKATTKWSWPHPPKPNPQCSRTNARCVARITR